MSENGGFYGKSESIASLSKALLKAQMEIGAAKKDSVNPFFKSSYADLGAVLEVCKEPLNKNGISVLQPIVSNGEGICVLTTLLHDSGEYLTSQLRIAPLKEHDPQAQGSAITYARRYALQAMLSIPSEDDDAEAAMQRNKPVPAAKPAATVAKTAEIAPGVTLAVFMPSKVESKKTKDGTKIYYVIHNGANQFTTSKKEEAELAQKALNQGKEIKLSYAVNGQYKNVKSITLTPDPIQDILETEPEMAEVIQ